MHIAMWDDSMNIKHTNNNHNIELSSLNNKRKLVIEVES